MNIEEKNHFLNYVYILCLDIELIINDKKKVPHNQLPCFLFNQKDDEWKYSANGLFFKIPKLFNQIHHRELDNTLWGFYDLFKNNQIDDEVISHFTQFKFAIFNYIKTCMQTDAAEEKNNKIYITFEMTVNLSRFLTYHMICLHYDDKYLSLTAEDKFNYQYTFSLIQYFCQKDNNFNFFRFFLSNKIERKYDRHEYNTFLESETRIIFQNILEKHTSKNIAQ